MEYQYETVVVNSDELTGGKDEVWNVLMHHKKEPACSLFKGQHTLDINPTKSVWYNNKRIGIIRPISLQQAEIHPFIIKFGDQKNARYYGVFKREGYEESP